MKSQYKFLIGLVGYVALCYFFLADLALIVQVPINDVISNLIDISAIFLAIVGMWVAYSYPAAVSKLVNDNNYLSIITSYESAKRLESLVMNILVSSIILISCLFLNAFIIPMVKSVAFFKDHLIIVKQIGYCFIWMLCLVQVVMVIQIIRANLSFLDELDATTVKLASQRKNKPHGRR